MKKLSAAALALALCAGCSSAKTVEAPDPDVKEATEMVEDAAAAAMTHDAKIIDAHVKYSAGDIDGTIAHFAADSTWVES